MNSILPYPPSLILDNTRNYGIMKTEAVFGFSPNQGTFVNRSFNATQPLEWIFNNGSFQKRTFEVTVPIHEPPKEPTTSPKKSKHGKKAKRQSKKVNKCIIKFLKKGQGEQESGEFFGGKKRKRKGSTFQKMQKKYMMPMIIGLLAAKSLLIPIALKALAFVSTKGLLLAFFSTVMASVMSLKGMFNHPHEYHKRNDDSKTQVEIIQIPTKSEDHVYYDDVHYKKGDFIPDNMHYRKGDYIPELHLQNDIIYKKSNDLKGFRNRNSGEKFYRTQNEKPVLMSKETKV